jgi:hypothetical protein
LLEDFKRKKGININDINKAEKVSTLVNFWMDSLVAKKIISKLRIKEQNSFSNQNAK